MLRLKYIVNKEEYGPINAKCPNKLAGNLSGVALFSDQTDRLTVPIIPQPKKPRLHLSEANNDACTRGREDHVTQHSEHKVKQVVLNSMLDMCK